MANQTLLDHEIDVRDVEYLRHDDRPLLARLFVPRGAGPFPMIVELHGGAWCRGDRLSDTIMNEALARSGVVVAALDFRMPPEAGYPASLQDISYGVRWLKSRAADFHGRAVVRAMVFIGSVLYILGLLLTDLSYTLVDPRVRLQ